MVKKISIKDIAKNANVSTATVSYVLNGTRNVRPKTRERVLSVIREMNYKPNEIAKSLKSQRTNTIGVIAEDVTVFNVPQIIDGIHYYADQHDLHILLTNMRLQTRVGHRYDEVDKYRMHAENAVNELLSKQVEGIIYIGVHPRDVTDLIDTQGKPIVYTYCYTKEDVSIQYNDEQASYDAMKYLVEKGHKRIAIITGLIDSMPSRLRLNGYYRAVTDWELTFDPQYIQMGDWGLESGYELTKKLLALSNPPTAILAMNDLMAVGALRAAHDAKIAVPEQLSIMGFDNRDFSNYVVPRLSTMNLPLHEMGYIAMKSIMHQISGEEHELDALEQSPLCTLIDRESVAPPKA